MMARSSHLHAGGSPIPKALLTPLVWRFGKRREECLSRFLLRFDEHNDPGIAFAATVDSAQALNHLLPLHQVADHVVRVEIDADLAGRRGEHEHGLCHLYIRAGDEAEGSQPGGRQLALVHPASTHEQLGAIPSASTATA